MSKKNDELKEIYDEYQKDADIYDKTPDVSKKQGLPKFKAAQKITAIILAGAVLVAAGVAIKNRKGTSNPTPVTTSDTTSPTDGDTTSDYEYVLVENFDINDNEQLKDFSVVTFKHSVGDKDLGTIGIIGPKRMDYSKVISVMNYISKKMNEKDI